jgi:hypothetical protein
MDSDCRGNVQAGLSPFVDGKIELRTSRVGCNRRAHEVIVSGVEENYSWAHFATDGLVKVDPNQDHFTKPKVL